MAVLIHTLFNDNEITDAEKRPVCRDTVVITGFYWHIIHKSRSVGYINPKCKYKVNLNILYSSRSKTIKAWWNLRGGLFMHNHNIRVECRSVEEDFIDHLYAADWNLTSAVNQPLRRDGRLQLNNPDPDMESVPWITSKCSFRETGVSCNALPVTSNQGQSGAFHPFGIQLYLLLLIFCMQTRIWISSSWYELINQCAVNYFNVFLAEVAVISYVIVYQGQYKCLHLWHTDV